MIKTLKFIEICTLNLSILLFGCSSSYKETFDCEPGSGIGCKSISQVNQMVDYNPLTDSPLLSKAPTPIIPSKAVYLGGKGKIVRIPEETMRVLIMGYRDEQGNFHENTVIHMVSKQATWGKIQ
jgi:hypothetical protein